MPGSPPPTLAGYFGLAARDYLDKLIDVNAAGDSIVDIASFACCGINWVPNKYPYYLQTSTKLLEYCAMNLKVVTLQGLWSMAFEQKNNAKFFNISEDFSNFTPQQIENYEFKTPYVDHLKWNNIIKTSGIEIRLNEIR